ncbi:MAG: glycerol kinase GlpK [Lachnospiraceae bacterium]|nr:glycerol kinase GlpK [Lachnospiraceae bacterium]
MSYLLGIDQSTQSTKAILFDGEGNMLRRADAAHRQIVNGKGWVSHDPEEIYGNVLKAVREAVNQAGISGEEIAAVGISNQRETTVLWDRTGRPLADAVVWQCGRAEDIARRLRDKAHMIYEKTGMPLSPYFPACKMAWLKEHVMPGPDACFGTVDSWLLYRLTGGEAYLTDYSNASRTQLFDIETLEWDRELCGLFGISVDCLPEVRDSNGCFGYTDFQGFLKHKIPVLAVLGDSHAALFGQGCRRKGMAKATYGTGSSIMMNIGGEPVRSRAGLATSLAWRIDGKAEYVLEGNINYTGAVVTWLKEDMGLIASPGETADLAQRANSADRTVLVPAFTGLSAPYWKEDARALLWGMSRTTGRAEVVRAALDSIACQVADVLNAMEQDCGEAVRELRVDGGPAGNPYLMQFQSDLTGAAVRAAEREEISALGAAYLAGIAAGIYDREKVFAKMRYREYRPAMPFEERKERYGRWREAVRLVLQGETV